MKSSTSEWRGEVTTDGPTDVIDTQWPLEASLTRLETDEILCVAHDISARQAHQRRLTGLAAASRELLAAEDCGAVGEAPEDIDIAALRSTLVDRYGPARLETTRPPGAVDRFDR